MGGKKGGGGVGRGRSGRLGVVVPGEVGDAVVLEGPVVVREGVDEQSCWRRGRDKQKENSAVYMQFNICRARARTGEQLPWRRCKTMGFFGWAALL